MRPPVAARVDPSHPLSRSLTGAWLFREHGGATVFGAQCGGRHPIIALEDCSRTCNATLTGGAVWTPNGVQLNGTNAWVVAQGTWYNLVTQTLGTIVARARIDQPGPSIGSSYNAPGIVSDSWGGGGYLGLVLSSTDVYAYAWDGNEDRVSIPYTLGQWATFAWVHANGLLSIYRDGILGGSVASNTTSSLSSPLYMGRNLNTGGAVHFNGVIGAVRTYKRALSAAELRWLSRDPYAGMLAADPDAAGGLLSNAFFYQHYVLGQGGAIR